MAVIQYLYQQNISDSCEAEVRMSSFAAMAIHRHSPLIFPSQSFFINLCVSMSYLNSLRIVGKLLHQEKRDSHREKWRVSISHCYMCSPVEVLGLLKDMVHRWLLHCRPLQMRRNWSLCMGQCTVLRWQTLTRRARIAERTSY